MSVTIKLDGVDATLTCTLGAAKEVNARFGSLGAAQPRLSTFDLSAFVAIVAAGLGKSQKDVEAGVFATGLTPLVTPLTTYVYMLANGGREPPKEGEKKDAPKGE